MSWSYSSSYCRQEPYSATLASLHECTQSTWKLCPAYTRTIVASMGRVAGSDVQIRHNTKAGREKKQLLDAASGLSHDRSERKIVISNMVNIHLYKIINYKIAMIQNFSKPVL